MEKLSYRLQTIADQVSPGKRLADIGCDHGFVPIYLIQKGIIPSAIAMDVVEGPLSRAREHIRSAGLDDVITTRLSDGLEQLQIGEVDTVLIAGMGGALTVRILSAKTELVRSLDELILEPQSELVLVRSFLREQNFCILSEEMVLEDGKYYPVLKICPKKTWSDHRMDPDLALSYGPSLLEQKHPVLRSFLEKEHQTLEQILAGLHTAGDSERVRNRKREVEASLLNNEKAMRILD